MAILSPTELNQKTIEIGVSKSRLPAYKMLLLGMFAGAFIALAGIGAVYGNLYVGKLAGACIFPAGLAMVVVAGSELFTGNNLMFAALLDRKIGPLGLLKNWLLVFLGNLIGALFITVIAVASGALDPAADALVATAASKTSLTFAEAMFRGILCNFLVCIAVWMSFAANSVGGKIAAVFFPVMLFVLCGFEHSIANMFYIPAGMLMGAEVSITDFLLGNLLPVTLGNLIGGAVLVAGGYYCIYHQK